ncbi:protein of unknown function (plasmid) [Caballeronia sp. S22]
MLQVGLPDPRNSGRSSLTMLLARESIRLCAAYLKRCFDDGADETARAAGRTSAQRRIGDHRRRRCRLVVRPKMRARGICSAR